MIGQVRGVGHATGVWIRSIARRGVAMTAGFSLYLDLVRLLAALAVLLTHTGQAQYGGVALWRLDQFGHDAVVVFFVLSGLVISHAVTSRETDVRTYAVNRLARLYSVVVPAICLTLAVGGVFRLLEPARYAEIVTAAPAANAVACLFFVNELWFRHTTDGPFWSLGFEVWYYVIFGCAGFLRGSFRLIAVMLCAAIMGPKLLLLLPLWFAGVLVQRVRLRRSALLGGMLFGGSIGLYLLYRWSEVSQPLALAAVNALPLPNLGMARYFASDYLVGLLVAANFAGFRMIERWQHPVRASVERPIRFGASYTFSLYLYHLPILQLLTLFSPPGSYLTVGLVVAACVALGSVTERRKLAVRRIVFAALDWTAPRPMRSESRR